MNLDKYDYGKIKEILRESKNKNYIHRGIKSRIQSAH
jgi:hypothetical protein